ncbi:hypothetical protein AVEN_124192-1 [Araneus ventricosus]|uniref:Uncharacterized protein n=1 Tax=Araneus ventricosus TaxID=182803 RepID=A0A4Y2PFC7_ARAVE|nr:hypothetical protein AVEN_124192-1 [Araneus ventricosus]
MTLRTSGGLARLPACPMASGPPKQKTFWAPRKCGREKKNYFSIESFSKANKGPCFGVPQQSLCIYCRRNSISRTADGRIATQDAYAFTTARRNCTEASIHFL